MSQHSKSPPFWQTAHQSSFGSSSLVCGIDFPVEGGYMGVGGLLVWVVSADAGAEAGFNAGGVGNLFSCDEVLKAQDDLSSLLNFWWSLKL